MPGQVEEGIEKQLEEVEAVLWEDAEQRRDRCNALLEGFRNDG